MTEAEVERVQRALRAALEKQRREALTNAWLTVLCTPVFVVLAAAVVTIVVVLVLSVTHDRDVLEHALTFYTAVNFFLAYMLVFVFTQSNESLSDFNFHPMWIAGLVLLLLILAATYGTSWPNQHPWTFAFGYMVTGLLFLGLIGQAPLPDRWDQTEDPSGRAVLERVTLVVPALIASAYGEVLRGSWLWKPPKDSDVRFGARVLCRLAENPTDPLHAGCLEDDVAALLARLRLIRKTDKGYTLTDKGQTFMTAAVQTPGGARGRGDHE